MTERIPVYLHLYTVAVVILAVTTSANWISSKPRFLVPLIGVLTVAATWFGLYLTVIAKWAP